MTDTVDARWPKILSLTVHELRTPMTVVTGYLRMLLQERAGAVTDQQRHMLQEAERSCARLSGLVAEISELSNLEAGTSTMNRRPSDVRAALREAVRQLPPLDHDVTVDLDISDDAATIDGDPVRLTQAFLAILAALRREVVLTNRLIVRERDYTSPDGRRTLELRIGDEDALAALEADTERPIFDEWRGGVGLTLAVARRLIDAQGGTLQGAPAGRKTGAVVVFRLT